MTGIIMLGISNSGKSTIGKAVAEKLGLRYISSGDIARQMNVDTDLAEGKLAPETEMRERIAKAIHSSNSSFILDGFPRFYDQYRWLDTIDGCKFIYVMVDVPDKQIIRRATSRGRYDDGAIQTKMQFYYDYTIPMIAEIMRDDNNMITIDNSDGSSMKRNVETICSAIRRTHVNDRKI